MPNILKCALKGLAVPVLQLRQHVCSYTHRKPVCILLVMTDGSDTPVGQVGVQTDFDVILLNNQ